MFGKNVRHYGYFIALLMFFVSGLSAAVFGEKNVLYPQPFEKQEFFTQNNTTSFLDFLFEIVEINLVDDVPSDDDDNQEDDQREYDSYTYNHLSGRHLTRNHTFAKFNPSISFALALTATPRYTLYCCWKNDLV